jgi:hypothetical protein
MFTEAKLQVLTSNWIVQGGGQVSIYGDSESSNGICILFDGGTSSASFSANAPTGNLLADLRHRLIELRYRTVQLTFPNKSGGHRYTTDSELQNRIDFARGSLERLSDAGIHNGSALWLGLSSGGTIMLNLLADHSGRYLCPDTAVLFSTVVDSHLVITKPVQNMLFLYGETDYIAYSNGEQDTLTLIPPRDYSKYPQSNLVTRKSQHIESQIVAGVGHLMRDANGCTRSAIEHTLAYLSTRHLGTRNASH